MTYAIQGSFWPRRAVICTCSHRYYVRNFVLLEYRARNRKCFRFAFWFYVGFVCPIVDVNKVLLSNDTKGKSNITDDLFLLIAHKFENFCIWVLKRLLLFSLCDDVLKFKLWNFLILGKLANIPRVITARRLLSNFLFNS